MSDRTTYALRGTGGVMETAIGVFASRDHAERAVRELQDKGVPEGSLSYLTRSESEAEKVAKDFGTYVGGFVGGAAGMTAGVVAASLLLPGVGTVFALGFGAAALLGAAGAGAGRGVGSAAAHDSSAPQPTSEGKISEEAAFLREVLTKGRSVVVVQIDSQDTARLACEILDRLGLGMLGAPPAKMQTKVRREGSATVVEVSGRITLGEGNVALRELVRELADKGQKYIVLNLSQLNYVDSSGIGELVKAHTTLRNQGGQLKLTNLSQRMLDLLRLTRLSSVFDVHDDEQKAIASLSQAAA
jgi:anti-sigma B factor antagonist